MGHMQRRGALANTDVLQTQLESRAKGLAYGATSFNDKVTELQREASRRLHTSMQKSMSRTYKMCAAMKGRPCRSP